jgi:hypothetical protein
MESNLKKSSLSIRLMDKHPVCEEHSLQVIAICLNETCKCDPICVNCLIDRHFVNHDKTHIIPLKEYLEKLDDYVDERSQSHVNSTLIQTKTELIDVLEYYKESCVELIESLKLKIINKFLEFEDTRGEQHLGDSIYAESVQGIFPVTKLVNYLSNNGIKFLVDKRVFQCAKENKEKEKILVSLGFQEFADRIDELTSIFKKKLIIRPSIYFRSFNIEDNKIQITETQEGILLKKLDKELTTLLIISKETLDFNKVTQWKVKPIHLPSRWMGIGILPRDKFKREGWNSLDLIGLNCDKYYLDRGNNQSNSSWEVTTNSLLSFTFDGPQRTLKIENTEPGFSVVAKNLDPGLEYCLALFFHYTNSEVMILN